MFKGKNLVIDTSVLIDSPYSIHSFDNSNIFLTLEVLEELDNHKIRKDHIGKAARYVNRFLDKVRQEESLLKGARLENGSRIYVVNGKGYLAPGLEEETNDNRIISVAFKLKSEIGNVTVLSNDIAFRVKCDSLGIEAQGYFKDEKKEAKVEKFSGVRTIDVTKEDIDLLFEGKDLIIPGESFEFNECIVLKNDQQSALAIAYDDITLRKLKYTAKKGFSCEGIRPRSAEQTFAMELMLDPEIDLVTVTGKAGCGKTLLAIATAVHNLHQKTYEKIIISRPVESTSKDIGYLPGDKFEKMQSWVQPIFDNLEAIFGKRYQDYVNQLMHKGQLEVEALTFIRGRSLPNTIFIIDEAQNINYNEAKAIITRMGENSKLILIGDLEQIDSDKLSEVTSGLSNAIEVFRGYEGAAHVTLRRGERSPLATYAAENM